VNVLVDTSVWSLALRRPSAKLNFADKSIVAELTELIHESRAKIIGIVRQELLSGIKNQSQFAQLQQTLRSFPDEPLTIADHESAARASNLCRSGGVAVALTDVLICAVSELRGWPIFTSDSDFRRYSAFLPIKLHQPRRSI
jgi:predicted nucleic acid-binding protein